MEFEVTTPIIGTIDDEGLGCIGWPILQRTNIYCDFPNSAIWVVSQSSDLNNIGVALHDYRKIPFVLEDCGIVLHVKSSVGNLRLLIDTGCSLSIINPLFLDHQGLEIDSSGNAMFPIRATGLFSHDERELKMYPFNITSELKNVDGIIGMDFLRNQTFYIDYSNRMIYVK